MTKRLQETLAGGDVSFSEMTSIQADQKLNDAEVLTPYITAALRAAHEATLGAGAESVISVVKLFQGADDAGPTMDRLTRKFRA